MKAKDFGHFLTSVSNLPELYGATESAQAWRSLATFFAAHPASTVSNICKQLSSAKPAAHSEGRADAIVTEIVAISSNLGSFVKKTLTEDLQTLARSLEIHRDHSLDAILAAASSAAQSARNSRGGPLAAVATDELVEKYLKTKVTIPLIEFLLRLLQ